MMRNLKIFNSENSALLIIDIQEKILPVIYQSERVIENTIKLIKGFKTLNAPVYFTEQYPKGLGRTDEKIKDALGENEPIEKMSFSCRGGGNLFMELRDNGIEQVALCGVESHVCVMQTALDLVANGFQVHVAADAVSSRRELDYKAALDRMRANDIEITLTESILFEMLNVCGTEQFKTISKLVK